MVLELGLFMAFSRKLLGFIENNANKLICDSSLICVDMQQCTEKLQGEASKVSAVVIPIQRSCS
jgi:hypothetical protein